MDLGFVNLGFLDLAHINWTPGSMMFYGGIAGAAATIVAAVIAAIILASGSKRIKNKLNQEYGEKTK